MSIAEINAINDLFGDVTARIKFLNFLAQTSPKLAYQYGLDLEMKNLFNNDVRWYDSLAEIVQAYEESEPKLDFSFLLKKIAILDRRTNLSIDEHQTELKSSAQCISALFAFDQALYSFSKNKVPNGESTFLNVLLNHFRTQLSFYLATLILKQTKDECGDWHKAEQMTFPLMLQATQSTVYFENAQYREKCIINGNGRDHKLWNTDAVFRISQAGHVLLDLTHNNKYQFLQKFSQYCNNKWQSLVWQKIFSNQEYQEALGSSYFMTDPSFKFVPSRLLTKEQLGYFDKLSQLVYPDSLDHLVWLNLTFFSENDQLRSDFRCTVFTGLPFTVKNLSITEPETLNQLDVDAFLYATVLCAKNVTSDHTSEMEASPPTLPVCISKYFCSSAQAEWWNEVYKKYTNRATEKFLERNLIIQKGIQTIRVFGRHGLHVKVVLFLAEMFEQRAAKNNNSDELVGLEARAKLYWSAALFLLEKIEKKEQYHIIRNQFFDYGGEDLIDDEIKYYIEYGRLFLLSIKHGKNEILDWFQLSQSLDALLDQTLVFPQRALNCGYDDNLKISECIDFAHFVRETYGFFIKNKVVVKHIAKLLNEDLLNILPKFYHPLAGKMLDAAMKQEQDFEGGTNFVIIFSGSLLEAALNLKKIGISLEDIENGFRKASKNSSEILKKWFANLEERIENCSKADEFKEPKNFIETKICCQNCQNDCGNGLVIKGKELFIKKKNGDLFNTRVILNEEDFRALHNNSSDCSAVLTCSETLNFLRTCYTDPFNRIMNVQTPAIVAFYPVFNFSWVKEEEENYCFLHYISAKLSQLILRAKITKDEGGKIVVTAGKTDCLTISCVKNEKLMFITLKNKSELLRLQQTIGGIFIEDTEDCPEIEKMGKADSVFVENLDEETCIVIFRLYQQKICKMSTLVFEDFTTARTKASYDNTYQDDSFAFKSEELLQELSEIDDKCSTLSTKIVIESFTRILINLVADIVHWKGKDSTVSGLEKSFFFGVNNATVVALEILKCEL